MPRQRSQIEITLFERAKVELRKIWAAGVADQHQPTGHDWAQASKAAGRKPNIGAKQTVTEMQ